MNTNVSTPLNIMVRKLARRSPLSDFEKASISTLPVQIADIARGQDVVRQGDYPTRCFAVLSGFACSFKMASRGNRQLLAFHLQGDVPELQSLNLPVLDFGIAAMSPCRVGFIQHEALRHLCEQHPRIAEALWLETLTAAAISREWILNNGQRQGVARVAHVFCEMFTRMQTAGLADGLTCDCPMTQTDLADATGMSVVHVNRCIKSLRKAAWSG